MKIYDRYNNVCEKQAYKLSDEVVTVQDQSETIQSILERLSRGVDAGVFERRPLELDDEDVAMQLDYADELDARNMQLELQQRQEVNEVTPVSQVTATEAILKKVNNEVIRAHMKGCLKTAILEGNGDEKIDELMSVVDKMSK